MIHRMSKSERTPWIILSGAVGTRTWVSVVGIHSVVIVGIMKSRNKNSVWVIGIFSWKDYSRSSITIELVVVFRPLLFVSIPGGGSNECHLSTKVRVTCYPFPM